MNEMSSYTHNSAVSGMPLADMIIKWTLCEILSEYWLLPSPLTKYPVDLDELAMFITCKPVDGIYLRVKHCQHFKQGY